MKVLVCGSRKFGAPDVVRDALDHMAAMNGIDLVIEGCASGPDRCAEEWAAEWGVPIEHHPADWARYGKSAGHRRNSEMLRDGRPDMVVAFWDGQSAGTAGMVKSAERLGVSVVVYRPTGQRA